MLEANPKNFIANANFAALQLALGDREYAHGFFTKALALNRNDYVAQLGLAECIANDPARGARVAKSVIAEAERLCPQADRAGSLLIANAYMAIGEYQRAHTIYKRVRQSDIASKKNLPAGEQWFLLEHLMLSALECKDFGAAAEYFPLLASLPKYEMHNAKLILALGKYHAGLVAAGLSAQKLTAFTLAQARLHFGIDGDQFYKLGRAFENAGQVATARECYRLGLQFYPDDGKIAIAMARRLVLDGHKAAARAVLEKVRQKGEEVEPTMRRTLVKGTVAAGIAMLANGSGGQGKSGQAKSDQGKRGQAASDHLNTSVVRLTHLSCLCKVAAINYILRRQPGVIFARVPEGTGPDNLLVYDPKVTSAANVWNKMGADAKYVMLPQKSGQVVGFAALAKLVADNYDQDGVPQKPYYEFERLPLRPL